MSAEALRKAVEMAGSQEKFGDSIGRAQATIWDWLNNNKSLPAEYVLLVEGLYHISRHELRPDIYPLEDRGSRDTQ